MYVGISCNIYPAMSFTILHEYFPSEQHKSMKHWTNGQGKKMSITKDAQQAPFVCVDTILMWDIELYGKVIIAQQLGIDKKSFDIKIEIE